MNEIFFRFPFFGHDVQVTGWKLMGSIGALMFAGRWLIQFFYTRRAGKPVTPLLFWIMSVVGSQMMLVYFIFSPKQDMVGILSNALPGFVAMYNLYLELRNRKRDQQNKQQSESKKEQDKRNDDDQFLTSAISEPAAGE